jgi:hypothetical protein
MSTNPSSRRAIGLTLSACVILGTAGCQNEPSPADTTASLPGVAAETPRDILSPPALANSDPQANQSLDSVRHEAGHAEHVFDAGVRQSASEVEGALPPPGAPAPIDQTVGQGLESAVTEINQGLEQASDEVRRGVRQSADQLAEKARVQTRRKTDQVLDKVEREVDETLQKAEREVAPRP